MKTITELVITRSKWSTPDTFETKNISSLLCLNGKMCCLGFACLELGLKEEDILLKSMPVTVINEPSQFTFPMTNYSNKFVNTAFADTAADINDDEDITNEQREERLTKLFAKNNITLSFVD